MAEMKFKFTIQPYQTEAVDSVVGVFAGQPFNDHFTYRRDVEIRRDVTNWMLSDEELYMGFANAKVQLDSGQLLENIRRIRDTVHIAVLLIEHDMNLVMGICEGIVVLNYGRIIAKGSPKDIQSNPQVIEAYLGRKREA